MTKTRKKKHKKLNLTKSKFRSPTSLSIFPERSPQLQNKEPNVLNAFTTKNIRVKDKHGQQWNTVENNKLAYNNMCASYNQLKEWDLARAACKNALTIAPNFKIAKNNLNWANRELNKK